MKQKVLFFVNSHAGGAEKMTLNIAGFLNPDLYDVIYYVVGKDLGLIYNFIPKDRSVTLLKVKSYRDFLVLKFMKTIMKEKPDYVFSSLFPMNWRLCLASAIFPRVKVIIRANNYLHTQSFVQKSRLFISYRFVDKMIVQASEMRDEHINLLKLSAAKVVTLPNPVNTQAIARKLEDVSSPYSHDHINYVFVGRLVHIKGVDILIKSFAIILKTQPKALLYIVGEIGGIFSDCYESLLKNIEKLDIVDKVIFTGFSDNPYVYMKFANCFVLPSRNEGLPNVVIESLFLGTPVAVTKSVPVISRIVRDGVDGYVVDVNDVNGLADAMKKAIKLGRVTSTYKSATKEDFQNLFQ